MKLPRRYIKQLVSGVAILAAVILIGWTVSAARARLTMYPMSRSTPNLALTRAILSATSPGVNYPAPMPKWENALGLRTRIDSTKARRNIKPYDEAARKFYLNWKPTFLNVSDGIPGWNGPDNFINADGPGDGLYIASTNDPTYDLLCVHSKYCGYSDGTGGIHIPEGARTQNSGARNCDCHLYILQPEGWSPSRSTVDWPDVAPHRYEIDLWNAANSAAGAGSAETSVTTFHGGGKIYAEGAAVFSTGSTGWYGGSAPENDGFSPSNHPPSSSWGGSANHGDSPYSATTVTSSDLIQGAINHEMFMKVVCADSPQSDSWPAAVKDTDYSCAHEGGVGWSYGDHVWLQMSDAEINDADLNLAQKVLAKGLAHYGAVILDIQGSWGPTFDINVDSGDAKWRTVAKLYALPATTWNGLNGFQLNMGLPLSIMNRMHAINSCVIKRTC